MSAANASCDDSAVVTQVRISRRVGQRPAASASSMAADGSRTKVRKVFLRKANKENKLLQGSAANVVNEFLNSYESRISWAIGKDIEEEESNNE